MDRINSFAVVAYLNGSLAKFVNELRRELTPDCPHRAHVTVLPPRPISVPPEEAIADCRQILQSVDPFEMHLGDVGVFETTQVIKLSFRSGIAEIDGLHRILNEGKAAGPENFVFVPHITLGQDIPSEKVPEALTVARKRWSAFRPAPPILIEKLSFVQQIADGCWADLAQMDLGSREPVGVALNGSRHRNL